MLEIEPVYKQIEMIDKFNNREKIAFSRVYIEIFNPLNYFAKRLFYETEIDSKDIVQDIFINIWGSKYKFKDINHIKSYLYQSIKNKHKDYLKHNNIHNNFSQSAVKLEEYQFSQIIETEVYSILDLAQSVLTPSCAEVLKLYIEGYDIKDISEKLGKSEFTVYGQKRESINILKKHLSNKQLLILLKFLLIS